jgi:aspartyl-tRNA(Asn)/glutamyl-tRNA(Gln) amidotransferase subunit C
LAIQREEVQHIARLARLALSEQEISLFEEQLTRILDYITILERLDTKGVLPLYHPNAETLSLRDDVAQNGGLHDEFLKVMAPEFEDGHFLVPSIIDVGPSGEERV